MKLFDIFRKGKHISVLVVPEGEARTFGFRLSSTSCKLLAAVALLCMVVVVFGAVTYWRVAQVALRAARLERENGLLRRENAKVMRLQKTLYEMKEIDHRLRMMAGIRVGSDLQAPEERAASDRDDLQQISRPMEEYPPITVPARWYTEDDTLQTFDWSQTWLRTMPSLRPVQGWVTAEFSLNVGPFGRRHTGIDIAAPSDSPVKAAADGVVVFVGWTEDLGNLVMIRHDFSFSTRYGHNSRVLVRQGERVKRGQTIALVGSSGRSSAPHLHFEIWKDGSPVNPREYLLR